MKVIVQRKRLGDRKVITENVTGFRSNHCAKIIAQRGGRVLIPSAGFEQGPSQSGLNQHWTSPRSWKHNRTMKI